MAHIIRCQTFNEVFDIVQRIQVADNIVNIITVQTSVLGSQGVNTIPRAGKSVP